MMIKFSPKNPVSNNGVFKWVFTCLIICSCCFMSIGQDLQKARIKLRSGSKLEGYLIGTLDSAYLRFQLSNHQPIIINYNDVKSIRFDHTTTGQPTRSTEYKLPDLIGLNTFFHEVSGGLLVGEDHTGFTLHTINGYQFSQFLGTGMGIGVDRYENHTTLPIYAQIKGYMVKRRFTPFYYGGLGYGFAWGNNSDELYGEEVNVNGGFMWQAGLGYRFSFNSVALNVNMGFKSQQIKTEYFIRRPWDLSDMEITEKRNLRRFVFSIGIRI